MKVCGIFQKDSINLALIRWYDFISEKTPYIYECAHLKLTDIYNLVEIEAIHDIVHIIPRFGKINEYFVNKFTF